MKTTVEGGSGECAVMIVAHPGHELRAHGWLEITRPHVFVITDGSGGAGEARINSTTRVLDAAGARPASIYGRYTDKEIYAAILDGKYGLFISLVDEMADALATLRPAVVAGDAVEDYNPTHDVCRLMINAALEKLWRKTGDRPRSLDFLLVGSPDACPEQLRAESVWLTLDDSALDRKMTAARGYPELAAEVEMAIARTGGVEPFRTECLRPVCGAWPSSEPRAKPPYYEEYGAKQVAAGRYDRVLRYVDHVLPLADALRRHVCGSAD